LIHSNFEWQHIEGHSHVCNVLLFLVHDLNYFISFFIIVEMKCKLWDITFAKYLKMWHPLFFLKYCLLELTYAFFTIIFSPSVHFKHTKHITLLFQKHILVQKTFSLHKIYLYVHHSFEKPCLQRLVNFSH